MFGACKASLVKGRCRQRRRRDSVGLYGAACPGKRAEPLRPASRPPPHRVGRLASDGFAVRERLPLQGSWPSPRGLRGFCRALRQRPLLSFTLAIQHSSRTAGNYQQCPQQGEVYVVASGGNRAGRLYGGGSGYGGCYCPVNICTTRKMP